jgi:hypothetical protein
VIWLDSRGLLAEMDASQRQHGEAAGCLSEASPPLVLSPFVLAELDLSAAAMQARRGGSWRGISISR